MPNFFFQKCLFRIYFLITQIKLNNANINRSPSSYEKNLEERLNYYQNESNTDKNFTQILITEHDKDNRSNLIGLFNWFAVHPTAMNRTNTLINGDVKGWASDLTEKTMAHLNKNFVAGFGSTNLGDVSPNLDGAKCRYDGSPPVGVQEGIECDYEHSTCPDRLHNPSPLFCIAHGNGTGPEFINEEKVYQHMFDMTDSTDIIAGRQTSKAFELMFSPNSTQLDSVVSYRHKYLHMPSWVSEDGVSHTCKPAMGVSFAAGTTDGPGASMFQQGLNWDYVNDNLGGDSWVWFQIRDRLSIWF